MFRLYLQYIYHNTLYNIHILVQFLADKYYFIIIKSFKTAKNANRAAMLAIFWLDPATLRLQKLYNFMNIALATLNYGNSIQAAILSMKLYTIQLFFIRLYLAFIR